VTNNISYSRSDRDINWSVVLLLRIQIERRVTGWCYACRLSLHLCVCVRVWLCAEHVFAMMNDDSQHCQSTLSCNQPTAVM